MGKETSRFTVVGRYVNEKDERDVVGYQLKSDETGKTARFGVDQMCILVGKERINDVQAQIYKDKVLFRGQNGLELGKLPAIKVAVKSSGRITNTPVDKDDTSVTKHDNSELTKNGYKDELDALSRKCINDAFDHARNFFKQLSTKEILCNIQDCSSADRKHGSYVGKLTLDLRDMLLIRLHISLECEKPADSAEFTKYFNLDIILEDNKDKLEHKKCSGESIPDRESAYGKILLAICDALNARKKNSFIEPDTEENTLVHVSDYYLTHVEQLSGVDFNIKPSADRVTVDEAIQLYDRVIAKLEKDYLKQAYNMENLTSFISHPLDIKLNIDGKDGKLYYVSINKWGFPVNTQLPGSRDKLIVSQTTLEIIKNTFSEYVTTNDTSVDVSEYVRAHYHDVVIRMRQFRHIPDFKKLRILYNRLNRDIFDNKLKKEVIVTVGNYSQKTENSPIDNGVEHCAAYYSHGMQYIVFNADQFKLQNNEIDDYTTATMIHEMCHQYTAEFLGGNKESDSEPEKWGDALYGLDPVRYAKQIQFHGEKFGKAVKLAAKNSKYTFEEIFGYGLNINSPIIKERPLPDKGMSIRHVGASGWRGWVKNTDNVAKLDAEIHKYDTWFRDKMNCRIELADGDANSSLVIRVLGLIGDFSEMYRLNFNDTAGNTAKKLSITLSRDYQDEGMGYKIKRFMLNDDSELPKVVKSILGLIKTDIQSV